MTLVGVTLTDLEKMYIFIDLPTTYNELIQKINSKVKLISPTEYKNKSITFSFKKKAVSIIDDETYKSYINLKIDELDVYYFD